MTLQKSKMKQNSFLFCFFMVLAGFSQNYKGNISAIKQDGLHKIMLTSKIRSATDENFGFVRIKDAQKNEVPYVLMYNSSRKYSTYVPINITSKNVIKDSITSVLIENKVKNTQEYLVLQISNTKVTKKYNVYGSNDGKQWFGLVANNTLAGISTTNKTTVEKIIKFPLNNYTFLRIDFNDKNSLPINILGAGFYKNKFFSEEPVKINDFKYKITEEKEKKVTALKFTAANSHKISAISFTINTDYFLRNAKLIVKKKRKVKKRVEIYDQVLFSFQLNSKNNNTFVLNNLNEKEFSIEIDNKDNPPLNIENIQLLQKPVYVIANLKKNESYQFVIDTTLSKPSYDLGNFISNETDTIKEVFINDFLKVEAKKPTPFKKPFWQTSMFMWICIVLGSGVVIYFALGLLKDIGKEDKS